MNVGRKYQYSGRMYQSSLDDSGVVETVIAKLLRVLLNAHCHGLAHYMLKKLVNDGGDVQRMHKGVFEVALATLVDRGLVCWHGVGNWAQYTIPGIEKMKLLRWRYADFGGEVVLILCCQEDVIRKMDRMLWCLGVDGDRNEVKPGLVMQMILLV
eukprot:jgi/Picre1/34308/NNA_001781.t1